MTNWEKYFGTPEKVSETMDRMNRCAIDAYGPQSCKGCYSMGSEDCNRLQLEWLRKEAS